MGCNDDSAGSVPGNPSITYLEPVNIECAANFDLTAVDLRILDEGGAGFGVLLSPAQTLELVVEAVKAASELTGVDTRFRVSEAQTLIETARRLGFRYQWIASRLGVSNASISVWKAGKMPPSAEHLAALRTLVRGLLRHD